MGLEVSHDAWRGAYSAFNRFRETLAKAAGIKWPTFPVDMNMTFPCDVKEYEKKHPGLYEFFCHSDCDGEIEPEMCGKVADELEELLPALEDGGGGGGHISAQGGYFAVATKFIAGCREAHKANETLDFY